MAQRRMFSPDIVCSDEFCEMPPSSRELYFQLGMRADDDGFIQYKGIIRSIGAKEDDLKVLIAKRFVLPFENGVVVIKHWLIHNMIRGDRYKETRFLEEKNRLFIKDNKAYTDNPDNGKPLLATKWQPNGNQMATQVRLGKVSIDTSVAKAPQVFKEEKEDTDTLRPKTKPKYPHSKEVFSWFPRPEKSWEINTTELKHSELLWVRGEKKVKGALAFVEKHKGEEYFPKITKPSDLERKWNDLVEHKV